MMRSNKLTIKIISATVLLLVLIAVGVFSVYKYNSINAQYPAAGLEEYGLNEMINHDEFEITVLESTFTEFSNLPDNIKRLDEHYKTLDGIHVQVKLRLKNNNDFEKRIDMMAVITTEAYANGFSLDEFFKFNDNATLTLNPGEELDLNVSYSVLKERFPVEYNLDELKYEFVVSLYPVKKVVKLN